MTAGAPDKAVSSVTHHVDVAVIGGGIAGLSAAHEVVAAGRSVVLLEASARVGGKMGSISRDGFTVERGPHSFLHGADRLWTLINSARARERVVPANKPANRYVYRNGRIVKLPGGPFDLLRNDWMSLGGKMRAAAEPFVRSNSDPDETLAAFARRRFGDELVDGLLAPFVSGIYAGNPDQLGAADAFPKLWRAERDHGSVIKGLVKARKSAADGPVVDKPEERGIFGFRGGLGAMAAAIGDALPDGSLVTGAAVESMQVGADDVLLTTTQGTWRAQRVVLALPAGPAAQLIEPLDGVAADLLTRTLLAPVALVHLGGPDPDAVAPRGFGALIARGEGVDALGILFPSSLFDDRAPAGHWLHAVFLGGTMAPDLVAESDEQLVQRAKASHRKVLGGLLGGKALNISFSEVIRHDAAIPQYIPGHRARIADASGKVAAKTDRIALAGACFHGISVADAAVSGAEAARRLLQLPLSDTAATRLAS